MDVAASVVEYFPASQFVHVEIEVATVCVKQFAASQSKQVSVDVAPSAFEHLPIPHV